MVGILIVDDDALVRMFLKQIVPWEDEGYTIVGDARDGEEALELLAVTHPDILLTDMSMSGMDGVTLIERAKAGGFDGGVVVLSCHDDFSYVKTAMQLGADEYLLKNHLNGPELLRVMGAVREKLEARRAQSGRLRAFAEKGLRSAQRELLESLAARPALAFEEQLSLTRDAGLRGRYHRCAVLLAQLPAGARAQTGRLIELCGQFASEYGAETVRFRQDGCALLADLGALPTAGAQRELLARLSAAVSDYAWRYLRLPVSVGVSAVCEGEGALAGALRQAAQALTAAFYRAGVYWHGTPEAALTDTLPHAAEAFRREIAGLVRQGEAARAESAYRAALEAIGQARVQPGTVLRWLRDCELRAGAQREEKAYAALTALEDYPACGALFAARARASGENGLPDGMSPAVTAAIRYIHAHFSEQITLGQAADAAGLTQNYFSSVFKHEVGVGFSTYLTECRIGYVCRRLVESGDMVKQIAADAGFMDYQHFCRTFRRRMGVSPAAYRKCKSEDPTTEIVK